MEQLQCQAVVHFLAFGRRMCHTLGMANKNTTLIPNQSKWGVYLWELPDGTFLGDSDGNYLSIDAWIGDLTAIKKMRQAAAGYGFPEGNVKFAPGRQRITQSEYEDQMEAFIEGDPIPGDTDD